MTSVPPPSGSTPPAAGPPEGWYQDPQGTGLRWWDGSTWTEHTHEAAPAEGTTAEAAPQQDPDFGLTMGVDEEEQSAPAQPETVHVESVTPASAEAASGGGESAEPPPSPAPPAAAPTTEPAAAIPSGSGATTSGSVSGSAAGGLREHARLLVLLAILVVVLIVALVAGAL